MSTVLALATRLRAMPDEAVLRVLRARAVAANGISDVFDLAEALLAPDWVPWSDRLAEYNSAQELAEEDRRLRREPREGGG